MLAAVAVGEAAEADRLRGTAVGIGAGAAALLALALAIGWAPLVAWALFALGTEYAVALVDRSSADAWVVAYAAAYLLLGELAHAALEERRVDLLHVLAAAALALAGGVLAAGILLAGQATIGGGLALEAVGVAAAVGAIAVVAALARRISASADG